MEMKEMDSHLNSGINHLSVQGSGNEACDSRELQAYQLVHESQTTRIFCNGEKGIKVLIEPAAGVDERLALLRLEQKVSLSLPTACLHRKVLRVDTHQGLPAMYFDWVEGLTAGEWLRSETSTQKPCACREKNEFDLTERLQLALAITRAVSDFHEAGLLHGQLSLQNVILNFSGGAQICSVTLIDYSKSIILTDSLCSIRSEEERQAFIDSRKRKDLNDLGVLLYSVLGNRVQETTQENDSTTTDEDNDEQRSKRGKRQQVQQANNLPIYLVSLIASLLAPILNQGGDLKVFYKSAKDVLADLQLAVQKPDIYWKAFNSADLLSRPLIFPQGSFYGRRTELLMLQHSFDAMKEGRSQPCALVVSGYAGAGKTTLLKQVAKPLKQSNGYMIVCKFNQTEPPPDTILSSGFDSFFEHVIKSDNEDVKANIKSRIEKILGERAVALEESMPHMQVLLGQPVGPSDSGDGATLKLRWKLLLSNLVYAIASQEHPIVLVFEDLQWADEDTLDTIQLIITDTKIRYCLYCMSYRDTHSESKLTQLTEGLLNKEVLLWSIKLGSIEKESVDALVSETLCMPPTVIEPLSCVVRSKTGGVILFVLNFLKSLHEERLIYFNLTSLRWEFDLIKIIQKEVSGDIIDFLSERIMRLPRSVQAGLKIAACLGSTFDVAVFQKANKSTDNVTEDFISMATENGFIHESSPNQFTWSHDQLQQAAYTLISTNMRQSTHLLVGARIFLNSRPEEVQSMIHDIVRNMNIGMSLLDSQERKTELAQLNLLAGEQSKKSSAFYSAANYFMTGIGLLDVNWQNSYDLAMKLYNSATEMLIITGNISVFQSVIDQPLAHAKNLEDRLPASHNFVRFLCVTGRFEDALRTCFGILAEFGEEFPSEVTPEIIHAEIIKTRAVLADFPKNNLLALKRLTDPMRLWMMKIMASTTLILISIKPESGPLIGCRIAQRSAEQGWCSDSAFGLYSFGHCLLSMMNDVEGGYSWVKAGLALLKEDNIRGNMPVLNTMYHVFVSFWKEPLQSTWEALIDTHQDALMEGQMEFACTSALHSVRQGFMCGTNLAKLSQDCISVVNKMSQLKQVWCLPFHATFHCLVLRLIGEDGSQAFAIQEMNCRGEDELLHRAIGAAQQMLVQSIYFCKLIRAYWLQNYDEVAMLSELYGEEHRMRFMDVYHIFYSGLAALHLAKRADAEKDKWVKIGEKAVSTIASWIDHSNWNFENKYLLLSAELQYVRGNYNAAGDCYNASIYSAKNHRFVHEEGLAFERLGMLYKEMGRTENALEMLKNASVCYEKWGATAVVQRLRSHI